MNSMTVYELIKNNPFISDHEKDKLKDCTLLINCITADSTKCRPGSLFVATRGATKTSRDGHDFIEDALSLGALIIVVDQNFIPPPSKTHFVVAYDSKAALCHLAETFYGFPSASLKIIGITGTNGKTSTSFMLHSILKQAGYQPKIMGTLGMGDPGSLTPLSHTTMDPEFISAHLAKMKAEGVSHVIMEISSHALSLKRVEALKFSTVALTNITQDHLDFHGSISAYEQAKARLFFELSDSNTIKILPSNHPFKQITNALLIGEDKSHEISFGNLDFNDEKMSFVLNIKGNEKRILLSLLGDYHAKNASLAAAIAFSLGVSMEDIQQGLSSCPPIPGRLEAIKNSHEKKVFIDFAHTPDALASLLNSVGRLHKGRLFLVFGCGGDRDKGKRPEMGKIAESLADIVVITDDNPRSEDPAAIRRDILRGMKTKAQEIPDRRQAIQYALTKATKNDLVIIAGKGHEDYQLYGNERVSFSDQHEVRKLLETL